jgi:uncharacterized membrane protein YfcA
MSFLIGIPTMAVGLWRHQELERVVLPMALGTVLGSTVGGWLVVRVPANAVELLLGCVLIASALRVFKVRAHLGHESVQPT